MKIAHLSYLSQFFGYMISLIFLGLACDDHQSASNLGDQSISKDLNHLMDLSVQTDLFMMQTDLFMNIDQSTNPDLFMNIDQSTKPDLSMEIDLAITDMDSSMPLMQSCSQFQQMQTITTLEDRQLKEISGIALSTQNPNLFWGHNDSDNPPYVYAFDRNGKILMHIELPFAQKDWEDLSLQRCPNSTEICIWIADIGDNAHQRDSIQLIAIKEPILPAIQMGEQSIANLQLQDHQENEAFWKFEFKYPQGEHVNAEAFLLWPLQDQLQVTIFEKTNDAQSRLFEAKFALVDRSQKIDLIEKLSFQSPGVQINQGTMITSATLDPSGTQLFIRVYTGIFRYQLAFPYDLSNLASIQANAMIFGPLSEPQGEAICWGNDGIYSMSETNDQPQSLHWFPCSH